MSTVIRKMEPAAIEALYKRLKPIALSEKQPNYTYWQIKTQEMTVTAYTSGKVVYQGADLSWLEDDEPESSARSSSSRTSSSKSFNTSDKKPLGLTFPQAGSDEVGTGDYFGPIVVAATIVPDEETARQLEAMQVTDSKKMTDAVIRKVAPKIQEMIPHTIMVLDNPRYNQIYHKDRMNINRIKAWMHNQAYINLRNKGYTLPALKVVDQFVQPAGYYRHLAAVKEVVSDLHFETKAESHYVSVAAASVLARFAFLKYMDKLEAKYGTPIAKGGGKQATECARKFKQRFGEDELKNAVKLHFTNTTKL